MTKEQNAQEQTAENVNVEVTAEQEKAQKVLRAKLPALTERGFNFEKRTGSLFKATLVGVFNEQGEQVIEDGQPKEKISRKVVEIENENGDLLPEFKDIAEELKAKRAAAFVLTADTRKEKLEATIKDLEAQLNEANEQIATHDITLHEACEVVMGVTLPEKASRVSVTAKLTQANDKLEKMKAMLLAAGLSEEEINAQLGL